MNPIALDRLKSQLLTTGLQQKDNSLWQVIDQLIGYLRQLMDETQTALNNVPGGSGGLPSESFLTNQNELLTLPFSRRLIAGQGIQFNDSPNGIKRISTVIPVIVDSGEDGVDGYPGPPGPIGLRGFTGLQGPPGLDANFEEYEIPTLQYNEISPFDGIWQSIPYNAANFTGSGTLVWTVQSSDLADFSYALFGRDRRTVVLNVRIDAASISGTGNELRIALPATITPMKSLAGIILVADAGTLATGFFSITGGIAQVSIFLLTTANWAASVNGQSVYFTLVYQK